MAKGIAGLALLCAALCVAAHAQEVYQVGSGIADITGPAAQINMMGYANPSQTTKGIHLRLFSRGTFPRHLCAPFYVFLGFAVAHLFI